MENQTKINSVIVIILLAIAGYTLVGDQNQEPTHYCEEREIKAFCYSLSSTMKTCYTEMNRTGGKRCDVWRKIGVEETTDIINLPKITGTKWSCPPFGSECIRLN